MRKEIVVVGSSNTDMIVQMERIPRPGETVLGGRFSTAPGGKGANQAVAAARAGGKVTFIARVGQDVFGEQAVAGFNRDRINIDFILRDRAEPSGVALIFVGADGENSIAVASGANARLSKADIKKAKPAIARAGLLVMQLETPLDTVREAAALAFRHGVRVILNPAPAQSLDQELLRQVAIITPNETEAELLTGIKVNNDKSAAQAAAILLGQGVGAVIITLGARGAWVSSPAFSGLVPGFKVTPVDTTAAGDVFNGALSVALSEEIPLESAVRFANAAAALSVTKLGAQPSAPARKSIEQFLKANGFQTRNR